MKFDPDVHHRRSIRLRQYDYSQAGAYFVTVCTHGKTHLFGRIVDGQMQMTHEGEIVHALWHRLPERYSGLDVEVLVVMPNHIHGIIRLPANPIGAVRELPARGMDANDVGAIHVRSQDSGGVHRTPESGELPLRGTERKGRRRMLLPKVMGYFKMRSGKQINAQRGTPGASVWQRDYYEHIIRNEDELNKVREYITTNPLRWASDRENAGAANVGTGEEAWYV